MSGTGKFSISHGHGVKPLQDWRLLPEDQDMLIEMRRTEEVKVAKTPRSTGRRAVPKRGKKMCKRTIEMF